MTLPTPEQLEAAAKLLCEMNGSEYTLHRIVFNGHIKMHAQCAEALRQVMESEEGFDRNAEHADLATDTAGELARATAERDAAIKDRDNPTTQWTEQLTAENNELRAALKDCIEYQDADLFPGEDKLSTWRKLAGKE